MNAVWRSFSQRTSVSSLCWIFMIVLFVKREMWQVFSDVSDPALLEHDVGAAPRAP
jgi:hypothetical protein